MVDSLRARNKAFDVIDLGDFMNTEANVGDLKSRFLWKSMEGMGYTASTPGIRELSNWKLYRELTAGSPIKSVCSNLNVFENGVETPAGLPYLITDVGGVRVGYFSLIGGGEVASARAPEGIEFRPSDPRQTAEKMVAELRKQVEVVVLLSHMAPAETDQIVKDVQGIDVAMYGRLPAWKDLADKVGNTITQQTGMRGQYFGQLVLIIDPDGRIVDWGSRNVSLDTTIPEKAEITAGVKKVEDEAKELMRSQQQQKATELENKISSDHYLGVDKCRRCHEAQYTQWASTSHARAFASLVEVTKQSETECVGCHVTGMSQPGGYDATMKEPDLTNVQCEACHGIGTMHKGGAAAKVTEETCTQCHTGEWGKARGFDFVAYLPKVTH